MARSLKLYLIGLVSGSAIALLLTSFLFARRTDLVLGMRPEIGIPFDASPEIQVLAGLAFWVLVTLFAGAFPVRMPRGTLVTVAIAPIMAAMALGGPVAAGWVAAIGTLEYREVRGRIPWYGSLANHAGITLPAIGGALVSEALRGSSDASALGFAAAMVGSAVMFAANVGSTAGIVALRTGQPFRVVAIGDARGFAANLLALAPLAWLMALTYTIAWWATLLFALPLYTTRMAYRRFVEMRDMFTQTIGALAGAVDKRDPFTSKHSHRVKQISVDIGREMRVSEAELEALEWGGLLHDVGKIGVPDAVLLKQERLNREERMIMNAHPVLGAEIIAPVTKLAPELPIIRHHHEWYNGSGYPDRLIGDEIPKLARILHVADAFEAMTAARPYRMTPLTPEQALAELRKFAGIQFDPAVVDAFVRTEWVDGVSDPGRLVELRPIPLLAQAAGRMTQAAAEPAGATRIDPV
ncbi:MAG: HD-GYP domain-containing protein [Chloroflexi bacterium]|nr:HD-GYP domain-containing protein [Chloroflexota bacterium]HEV8054704.1 HD-GYP domain-containing protein [Candidatus Limnocylindrales bacterium]